MGQQIFRVKLRYYQYKEILVEAPNDKLADIAALEWGRKNIAEKYLLEVSETNRAYELKADIAVKLLNLEPTDPEMITVVPPLPDTPKDKVVLNKCYGGFGLSDLAIDKYKQLTGKHWDYDDPRDDIYLVAIVEQLGELADGHSAKLKIESVSPNDWRIDNYDGYETLD
jgi:hypothetical protein